MKNKTERDEENMALVNIEEATVEVLRTGIDEEEERERERILIPLPLTRMSLRKRVVSTASVLKDISLSLSQSSSSPSPARSSSLSLSQSLSQISVGEKEREEGTKSTFGHRRAVPSEDLEIQEIITIEAENKYTTSLPTLDEKGERENKRENKRETEKEREREKGEMKKSRSLRDVFEEYEKEKIPVTSSNIENLIGSVRKIKAHRRTLSHSHSRSLSSSSSFSLSLSSSLPVQSEGDGLVPPPPSSSSFSLAHTVRDEEDENDLSFLNKPSKRKLDFQSDSLSLPLSLSRTPDKSEELYEVEAFRKKREEMLRVSLQKARKDMTNKMKELKETNKFLEEAKNELFTQKKNRMKTAIQVFKFHFNSKKNKGSYRYLRLSPDETCVEWYSNLSLSQNRRSISFDDVCHVSRGRHLSLSLSPLPNGIQSNQCLSVQTEDRSYSFAFPSEDQLLLWLDMFAVDRWPSADFGDLF